MSGDRVLILGAGLAGLSSAYHLEGRREVDVLEREARVGGLARSFHVNGFTFDLTGHLLHFRRPEIERLVHALLPGGMARIERRSYIYSHGVHTDYPFQANLHGLPPQVVRECLVGFIEAALAAGKAAPHDPALPSFAAWGRATFGEGIARHFLFPYNRKLWCRDLDQITAEWVSWAVPRPSVEEVVGGALGIANRGLGYNPSFIYPVAGGIEVLPNALATALAAARLHLRTSVASIDTARRVVTTQDGTAWPYADLVSTLPLPRLASLIEGAPAWLSQAGEALAATRVVNINLGIARPEVTHRHWIYYPEEEFVFYRVGSPTAFCAASAPAGCSSLYVEVAVDRLVPREIPALVSRVHRDLVRCGLLQEADRVVARQIVIIDPAYVVFDRQRRENLPRMMDWLAERGIRSIGRYGRWEYGSMEDALHQGREAALELSGAAREAALASAGSFPPAAGEEAACPAGGASR